VSDELIHTIEGQTPFDEDYRADLIPSHITLLRELNEYEAANIHQASVG
jgi:hypothetical protein